MMSTTKRSNCDLRHWQTNLLACNWNWKTTSSDTARKNNVRTWKKEKQKQKKIRTLSVLPLNMARLSASDVTLWPHLSYRQVACQHRINIYYVTANNLDYHLAHLLYTSCTVLTTKQAGTKPCETQPLLGTTVFRGTRNFEPSHGICPFPRNFYISAEFGTSWWLVTDINSSAGNGESFATVSSSDEDVHRPIPVLSVEDEWSFPKYGSILSPLWQNLL